jgi:hypothetical protein
MEALVSIYSQRYAEAISVGVVYHAGHVPAITAGLLAR